MPIYTRAGDRGKTSLFDGTRVLKSDIRVDTYGTIDELNSAIGTAVSQLERTTEKSVAKELRQIQHDLLEIGSTLAHSEPLPVVGLSGRPLDFEKLIDRLTNAMPELKNFILPGGGPAGAALHVARTTARRAERNIVALMQKEAIDETIVRYINRLSDLLFTMARYVNHLEKHKETIWKKK